MFMKASCAAGRIWKSFPPNVKFHNGNPFNADDVLFSYERTLSEGSDMRTRITTVDKVVKVDDYTVDFITKMPYPILVSEWSTWFMMDKEWCQKNGATESHNVKSGTENYAVRHANGTGPFIIVERETDVKTVLKPNKDWWDTPKHNLTEVIFTPISSEWDRSCAPSFWA